MKKTISALVAVAVLGGAGLASASMPIQKAAKTAGVEVKGCIDCHTDKMPKKDAAALNDKGKWLVDQKKAKAVKDVDGAWLKDYKEAKK